MDAKTYLGTVAICLQALVLKTSAKFYHVDVAKFHHSIHGPSFALSKKFPKLYKMIVLSWRVKIFSKSTFRGGREKILIYVAQSVVVRIYIHYTPGVPVHSLHR